MKAPKEVKECLICLKKVGNQWERHIKLHKERVGDKLYEQTVCPSWDCEQIFEDRISLSGLWTWPLHHLTSLVNFLLVDGPTLHSTDLAHFLVFSPVHLVEEVPATI